MRSKVHPRCRTKQLRSTTWEARNVGPDCLNISLQEDGNTADVEIPYRTMGSIGEPVAAGRPRRMTLPKSAGREDPIYKQATVFTETPAHGAAFIFIHGLGDDAKGLEGGSA